MGHLVVDKRRNARSCGCGKRGCLEAYLSLTSLTQRLHEAGIDTRSLTKIVDLSRTRKRGRFRLVKDCRVVSDADHR